jgi:hypothetical protein
MEAGYLLCGLCALAAVLAAERGRLFQPQDIPDARHALAE